MIVASLLFTACVSSESDENDSNSAGKGIGSVLSLDLDQSTRVTTEADATNGVLTKWSDNEKINSYHKYNNKGVAQSLMTLPFTNQSGNVQNGLFTYTNSGTTNDYRFNPGNMIYLFNNLNSDIASNYTVAANTSTSVFTLTLKNLQNQTGTVAGLAAYDGMYGTLSAAAVNDAKTVGPANTHHLTSVLRFDLTNADFANNTVSNVNVWNAPSANNSAYTPVTTAKTMTANAIIPSSGVFTLNADGTLASSPTLTGYSKWSPSSSITASSGTASVYLMTLPFQNVTGALLTFNAKCGSNYYEREMWIDGLSLTSGAVTTKKVSLTKVPQPYTSYPYYKWDAATAANVAGNRAGTGVKTTINGKNIFFATQSCKDCPTFDEICMYVAAGTYWDRYKAWVDFQGNLQHGGLWMKKKNLYNRICRRNSRKSNNECNSIRPWRLDFCQGHRPYAIFFSASSWKCFCHCYRNYEHHTNDRWYDVLLVKPVTILRIRLSFEHKSYECQY
jgi:hypothetical protein